MLDSFTSSIKKEYTGRASEFEGVVETIYFGGGTPSQMPTCYLDEIISVLPLDNVREFTLEVNPEDVDSGFLKWISSSPVTRVSMGVQSFNNSELMTIGRRHTPGKASGAVMGLREAGISNISLDIMYGLPGQTVDSFLESLDQLVALQPEHISAYALMLEPGTRLSSMIKTGKIKDVNQEDSDMMYQSMCHVLGNEGYEHYEISNFARPGFRSIHNSSYWNLTPYLGLGPSAHSYTGGRRRFNPSLLKQYIDSPVVCPVVEDISDANAENEYIMIRMRTAEGLNIHDFKRRFGASRVAELKKRIESVSSKLCIDSDYVRIPESLWLVSDPIIVDLMTETC